MSARKYGKLGSVSPTFQQLGKDRIDLGISPIVLGTMRFNLKSLTVDQVQNIILSGLSLGVDTLHVSTEYDSFPLVGRAVEKLHKRGGSKIRYVVKLASPHFGEQGFDKQVLFERVNQYLSFLNCDCLSVVQWMWRSESDNDGIRCLKYNESFDEICEAFDQLIAEGKVGCFGCFPYGNKFMRNVRESGLTQIQIDYCNLLESNLWANGFSHASIALRPYAAGRIFEKKQSAEIKRISDELGLISTDTSMELALKLLLYNSSVAGVVVSFSNAEQLESCMQIASNLDPDPIEFAKLFQLQSAIVDK